MSHIKRERDIRRHDRERERERPHINIERGIRRYDIERERERPHIHT